MKKFNILAFQRYKIFHSNSRNDKVMVKTKKLAEGGDFFFVPNCISKKISAKNIKKQKSYDVDKVTYTVRDKKKSPRFDHNFVIP